MYGYPMKLKGDLPPKGVAAARRQLSAVLSAAASGHITMITRYGRPVAAMVPAPPMLHRRAVSLLTLAGSGRGLWGRNSTRTIIKLRDEWTR